MKAGQSKREHTMRHANSGYGWVDNEQGQVCGVALGHGSCAEHEWGADPFFRALGVIPSELGLESMRAHASPPGLRFETWKEKKPRASTKNKDVTLDEDKLLEAMLYISARALPSESPAQGLRQAFRAQAWPVDPLSRWYDPARHDMSTLWDESEAVIWVRGAANIARLQQIHDALRDQDAVVNLGTHEAFGLRNSGLSFGIYSRFSDQFKQDVIDQDMAARRLEKAVIASGIREELKAAGKGYYALSPEWINPVTEEGLEFFLNPADQASNNFGWFSLDELRAWTQNTGPVRKDAALEQAVEAFKASHGGESPAYLVLSRLDNRGLSVRRLRECWADDHKSVLGVEAAQPFPGCSDRPVLKAGRYAMDELLQAPDLSRWCAPVPPPVEPSRRRALRP